MTPSKTWLALRPHDTVHVRDGRTFVGGEGGRAETTRPSPSTIAGAIGAACREALGTPRLPDAVRGPVLVRSDRSSSRWSAFFPVPRDLLAAANAKQLVRGQVSDRSACVTDLDHRLKSQGIPALRPVIHTFQDEKLGPVSTLIRGKAIARYLADPSYPSDDDCTSLFDDLHDPLFRESRVGIQLGCDKQTKDGAFYQVEHWRLADQWAFAAECAALPCSPEELPDSVRFGGISRMADIEHPVGLAWPSAPEHFPGGRLLLYLATPAVWEDGWLPPLPPEATLVAAAVGPAESFSTAVPSGKGAFQGTSLRFTMTPAGSVYYLQFPSDASALEWSQKHHGRALGPAVRTGPNRPRLDTAGFGVVLTGVWK